MNNISDTEGFGPIQLSALLWDVRAQLERQLRDLSLVHRLVDELVASPNKVDAAMRTHLVTKLDSICELNTTVRQTSEDALEVAKTLGSCASSTIAE